MTYFIAEFFLVSEHYIQAVARRLDASLAAIISSSEVEEDSEEDRDKPPIYDVAGVADAVDKDEPAHKPQRGRGRPRKSVDTTITKKARGRPRKPIDAATTKTAKAPPGSASRKVPPRRIDASVTVTVDNQDIDVSLLDKLRLFLLTYCIKGLFSVERGGSKELLHFQGVIRSEMFSCVQMMSKTLRLFVFTKDDGTIQKGGRNLCRELRGKGLHTFLGMIGYCTKDMKKDHFKMVRLDVSDDEIREGSKLHTEMGAGPIKNKTLLSQHVLFARCGTYWHSEMGAHPWHSLDAVMLRMMRTGLYLPHSGWVVPYKGAMDWKRACAMWRMVTHPETIDLADIHTVFFGNSKAHRYYDNDGTRNEETFRIAQRPKQHTAHSGDDFIPLEDSEDENSDAMAGAEEPYRSE